MLCYLVSAEDDPDLNQYVQLKCGLQLESFSLSREVHYAVLENDLYSDCRQLQCARLTKLATAFHPSASDTSSDYTEPVHGD